MDIYDKLTILSDAAKYDVACTSSGVDRGGSKGSLGSAAKSGICHSFSADGRCISLLKVLMTNSCIYDCKYCLNRHSNEIKRAAFTPRELADLTIAFYRRNYIEGLFLSSGVLRNPDYTCERMIETLAILRDEYNFRGYIHAKAIPGASDDLLARLGQLADRMSVNIELPSKESLALLAPDKSKTDILRPMSFIKQGIEQSKGEIVKYRHAPVFAPAGQSTQMIVGATPDTDFKILNLTQGLYKKYGLKRVFFSAYTPVHSDKLLPALDVKPPLMREHRLYQADWLLRFYGFDAAELLDEEHQNFNPLLDPKANWAINHMELFPVEVNTAPKELLLRVPGVGVKSTYAIMTARRNGKLDFAVLKRLGVVLRRAQFFITCGGKLQEGVRLTPEAILGGVISRRIAGELSIPEGEQLSLFAPASDSITREDVISCLTGQL
ncbi:MAG: putative DNA modification/repair radical SAM protein [Angelakisella sp.]